MVRGRICLLGEHADWAVDFAEYPGAPGRDFKPPATCSITAGLPLAITATATRSDLLRLTDNRRRLPEGGEPVQPFTAPAGRRQLAAAVRRLSEKRGFWAIAAATALTCLDRARLLTDPVCSSGIEITFTDQMLPTGKGLASSAAAAVVVVEAVKRVYDLSWPAAEVMELAYQGERLAGSPCGRMDQVCALGDGIRILTHAPDGTQAQEIPSAAPILLLLVDLGGTKDTRAILSSLQAAARTGGPNGARLRDYLLHANRALVTEARQRLLAGDIGGLGELMSDSQARFDEIVAPIRCTELAAPRLHELLEVVQRSGLSVGGKGVGSHGDGMAQFLCADEDKRNKLGATIAAQRGYRIYSVDL